LQSKTFLEVQHTFLSPHCFVKMWTFMHSFLESWTHFENEDMYESRVLLEKSNRLLEKSEHDCVSEEVLQREDDLSVLHLFNVPFKGSGFRVTVRVNSTLVIRKCILSTGVLGSVEENKYLCVCLCVSVCVCVCPKSMLHLAWDRQSAGEASQLQLCIVCRVRSGGTCMERAVVWLGLCTLIS